VEYGRRPLDNMNLFVYCCGRIILQIENMLERVFHVLVHQVFLIQRHVNLLYVFLVFVRHNDESALSNRTLVVKGVVLGERGDAL